MKYQTNLFEIAEIRSSRRLLWMAVLFTILALFGQPSARASCPTITLTPSSGALPAGEVGCCRSAVTFSASGGKSPYTFTQVSGTLPPGIGLTGGTLSGICYGRNTYNFCVKATDANGCNGTNCYSLTISCPTTTLNPSPGALPSGRLNSVYSEP